MKKFRFLAVLLCCATAVMAQGSVLFVAAKAGLNLRERPDLNSALLDKIPYGTQVTLLETGEASKRITTEGFLGYWKKITYNQKTGYIIDSYLIPVAPPGQGVKTLKEYMSQLSPVFGDKLVITKGDTENAEEGGSALSKQLFKNGAEWHEYQGYEYNSMTYFIPGFSIQQAFLLLRLLPEFKEYIGEKDEFITSNKKMKKSGREYEYKVEKEIFGDTPWINKIRIGFEEGAIYTFEMYQIDDQVVIFYGSGV